MARHRIEAAVQHAVAIARRVEAVIVGGERGRGRDRLHEIGRDQDDELGLAALERGRAEEGADDRQIADPGIGLKLLLGLGLLRLQHGQTLFLYNFFLPLQSYLMPAQLSCIVVSAAV